MQETPISEHYYVQDNQGNNRMVVNARTNMIEQNTHYYPYGELIGDISTNSSVQDYKYGGKELDRTYGLDFYDFEARQLDSKLGTFISIDPLSEKYYGISPYAYCAGDPVNLVDPTGKYITVADPNDSTGTSMLKYDYISGCFRNSNGDAYTGNDTFISNLTCQLHLLDNGKEGSMLLMQLCLNKNGVKVVSGKGNSEKDGGEGEGGIRSIVSLSGTSKVPNGTELTSLAHEFAHSLDRIMGTLNLSTWFNTREDGTGKDIPVAEIFSTFIENKIRAEHCLPLRSHYARNEDGSGIPEGQVVDSKGFSLYYKSRFGSRNKRYGIVPRKHRYKF